MKKWLAIALALLLAGAPALAAEISWSNVAPALEAEGLRGEFISLGKSGIRVWMPEGLRPSELSEAELDDGYVVRYANADDTVSAGLQFIKLENETFEDVKVEFAAAGLSDIAEVKVNGFSGMSCVDAEMDSRTLVLQANDAWIMVLTCEPAAFAAWRYVGASIQWENGG